MKDQFNKPCKFKISKKMTMIGRNSRKGRITIREETGLKARTKVLIKVNLQRKEILLKTRRKVLIRRKFNASNVRSLDTLLLNVGLVKESKLRMMKNRLRLHKMIQIHYY